MDGRQSYDSKEISKFSGLLASVNSTKDDFPDGNSPYLVNFINTGGVLETRQGRRRLNDTTYGNAITSISSFVDRNNISHLIFSVQSALEGSSTPDGTLKDELNASPTHPLVAQWQIGGSYHCYDIKVRGEYVYVMLFTAATGNAGLIYKYEKDGTYVGSKAISAVGIKNCFEVDDLGYLYFYREVAGGNDLIIKQSWSSSTNVATYTLGATPIPVRAMLIHEGFLYVAYHDGTNSKIDKLTLALALSSNIYSVVAVSWVNSMAFTRNNTMFITTRIAAGTTRLLYYLVGGVWTGITGEYLNLPARIVSGSDNLYISLVDDTVTGASQAMFYVYDSNMAYKERLGNAFLSPSTKNKVWDIATVVSNETATIEIGSLLFDVDSDSIYFLDAVTDSAALIGFTITVKKFRR